MEDWDDWLMAPEASGWTPKNEEPARDGPAPVTDRRRRVIARRQEG
jgi:hypothetical protein